MEIVVKNFLGEHFNIEDAIVLRDELKKGNGKDIVLNFEGIENVPATFFNCLFGDFLYGTARKDIFNKINVKNLSNIKDYSRVVLGTAFVN